MIQSKGDKIFAFANYVLLVLVSLGTLLPFLHVIAKSTSAESAVMAGEVTLWPIGFNLNTYDVVLGSYAFLRALMVSVFITVVGTLLHVLVMSLAAYPLSREDFVGQRFFTFMFVFTMLFSGGLIPTYLVVRQLGLINKIWALILPALVSPFNLIILRNYFMAIPDSLEEAARLDGCTNIGVFFGVMAPLALPAMATVCVFTAVGFWNGYFSAMIYIESKSLQPLSLYLRQVVMEADAQMVNLNPELANLNPESVRSATVIAATLPILLVYPFLQRFFVQGVMLGSVKG